MAELDKANWLSSLVGMCWLACHCAGISNPGVFLCIKTSPNFSQNFCGHNPVMKCCETVQFTVHCSADYCIESFFSLLIIISKTSPSPETPYEYFHVGTHGTIIKELLLTTRKLMALKSRKKKSLYFFLIFLYLVFITRHQIIWLTL